jgi:hypothetical protein
MSLFGSPTSFRLNSMIPSTFDVPHHVPMMYSTLPSNATGWDMGAQQSGSAPAEGHPSVMHLALLVFEAVMEVVCVSLPGYIIARSGLFDTENQKFVANLNVSLFTPCLSKLVLLAVPARAHADGPQCKSSQNLLAS